MGSRQRPTWARLRYPLIASAMVSLILGALTDALAVWIGVMAVLVVAALWTWTAPRAP